MTFLIILVPLSVSAEEVVYENVITDNTTIEEDFKVIQQDINDYYISTTYNYDKWYMVGMSEAYIENKIQTYFYLYNPKLTSETPNFSLQYKLNNESFEKSFDCLVYMKQRGLVKIKGFTYDYISRSTIEVTFITAWWELESTITSGWVDEYRSTAESAFKAILTHSLLNQEFAIELNYNSTLIIEESVAVNTKITQENNLFSNISAWWSSFWDGEKSFYLTFYNFNFPKRIKPTSIEYAKFSYVYSELKKTYQRQWSGIGQSQDVLIETKILNAQKIYKEYEPNTYEFQSNGSSQKLEFPTFYIGNRVTDNQFGYLKFADEQKKLFNYDCSILLDSYVNSYGDFLGVQHKKYDYETEITEIEFLELHYEQSGVLYKCQVVSESLDPEDIAPSPKKEWWDKLFDWIKAHPFETVAIVAVIVIGLPLIISFLPTIIGLMITLFTSIFKLIAWIIKLPFVIITYPFRRKE